jgi:hypothetical protein
MFVLIKNAHLVGIINGVTLIYKKKYGLTTLKYVPSLAEKQFNLPNTM